MNYILLTYDAIVEITSIHQLQSPDFDESAELCAVLRGETKSWQFGALIFVANEKGGFFFTNKPQLKKGLVFDLTTFHGFKNGKNDALITIFQKVLKFAIRYFEKLPPTSCEKHIAGENTCIVFPFPFIATKVSFRVLIDKNFDIRRLERREKQFLLVYGCGLSDVLDVEPNYQNLTKAIEESQSVCMAPKVRAILPDAVGIKGNTLQHTKLESKQDLSINANIGYENWKHYITNAQKTFIEKNIEGPERLEGAAGTGKTLTIILRCIYLLEKYSKSGDTNHILFITHSMSTKNQILDIIKSNYNDAEKFFDRNHSNVSVTVTTLQEYCISFLGSDLGVTEYLDRDAQDSKILQKMYLQDAFEKTFETDFNSFKIFCSAEFIHFIQNTEKEELIDMLQHEVSVTIKGRANENIEKYKALPRLKYSIPCKAEGDLSFLFLIFTKYQDALKVTNQFDSDDIVLTALGQLDTPIWRRRRERDGYNTIFVDETHLFNLNELSIIHNLSKEHFKNHIIFTIDKSQGVGDKGLLDEILYETLGLENLNSNSSQKLTTIFRSSPEIVNIAFNILSSGATLFTNFENPMDKVSFNFIEKDGKHSISPKYVLKENDETVIIDSFHWAEKLKKELHTQNSKILIVATSELIFTKLEKYANASNKPIELLKSRGDIETVKHASKNNRFLLAGIDFVGGLEFDGVVIVGVDKGRVPPINSDKATESFHFMNYAWHNRMYVAVTRAKYAVVFIGDKSRGVSALLESSIANESIIVE